MRHHGYTLLELSAALLLAGLVASASLSAASSLRDRLAVVGAREAVAGLVAEARLLALAHGGATVHLDVAAARAWTQVGDSTVRSVAVRDGWGVSLGLGNDRGVAVLPWDALGLGKVASETLRFGRGDAERALVVSAYGRVRRP